MLPPPPSKIIGGPGPPWPPPLPTPMTFDIAQIRQPHGGNNLPRVPTVNHHQNQVSMQSYLPSSAAANLRLPWPSEQKVKTEMSLLPKMISVILVLTVCKSASNFANPK